MRNEMTTGGYLSQHSAMKLAILIGSAEKIRGGLAGVDRGTFRAVRELLEISGYCKTDDSGESLIGQLR